MIWSGANKGKGTPLPESGIRSCGCRVGTVAYCAAYGRCRAALLSRGRLPGSQNGAGRLRLEAYRGSPETRESEGITLWFQTFKEKVERFLKFHQGGEFLVWLSPRDAGSSWPATLWTIFITALSPNSAPMICSPLMRCSSAFR